MKNLVQLIESIDRFLYESPLNKIADMDIRIFDGPVIGIANSEDDLFMKLKEEDVIGPHHMTPKEWFSEASVVISYFLPFTEDVRKSNRLKNREPSREWLLGRIEGETLNKEVSRFIVQYIERNGGKAVIPTNDSEFTIIDRRSNWSERHVAYIAGLGTFGLSKSFISEKGSAGRMGSVIVNVQYPITPRSYKDIYEYCNQCGACINRCPVAAISKQGKSHDPCEQFLNVTKEKYAPRYGCGKCQTAVPCENRIPNKILSK